MSAAGHRRAADQHERRALQIETAPQSSRVTAGFPVVGRLDRDVTEVEPIAQPGVALDPAASGGDERAKTERDKAKAHRFAAAALEEEVSRVCELVASTVRETCPLTERVVSVEAVPSGVELRLAAPVEDDAFLAHVQCHMAIARSEHDEGGHHCPLTVPSIAISLDDNRRTVIIHSNDAAAVSAIQARTAELEMR